MARSVTPLKLAIVASGQTQREVATAAELTEARLSLIVNGHHCDSQTRKRLADVLGKAVDDLFPSQLAA
jgi:transcriptional regulator with XRE-family HTH domain